MSPVDDKARDPEEQTAGTRHQFELGYEDWPMAITEPYEPTEEELDLLHSHVTGHRWHAWRRLTRDEDYYAACSCGWRSTETGSLSPMLRQVGDHLDAVLAVRGGHPSTRAPAQDEGEYHASQREMRPDVRARELYAAVENRQGRLAEALERSTDLLSASQDQADRFVAVLEQAAARIAPDWEQTSASALRKEVLQRRLARAKELRTGIVTATAALAAIAEEIALVHQDLNARHPRRATEHRRLTDEASKPAGQAALARALVTEQAQQGLKLLDQVVNRIFLVGLSLQTAVHLPQDEATQPIADALQALDDAIREVRDHVFPVGGHDGPIGPAPQTNMARVRPRPVVVPISPGPQSPTIQPHV